MPQTLSVITAAHGGKLKHLHDTYQSLCNQELPDGWEVEWILLIDSGHSYYFPDDVYVPQGAIARVDVSLGDRHHGPNVLRNIGLASSIGDLIKVLDADDILLPGALARDITILTTQPETDFVVSAVYDMSEDGENMITPAHLPAWQPFTHHPTNEGGIINPNVTIEFAITNFIKKAP